MTVLDLGSKAKLKERQAEYHKKLVTNEEKACSNKKKGKMVKRSLNSRGKKS